MQDGSDVAFAQSHDPRDRAVRHASAILERHQLALAVLELRQQPRQPSCVRLTLRQLVGGRPARHVHRRFEREVTARLPPVIDGDTPRDRHHPGRESAEVAAIAMAPGPRLLERPRRQILRVGPGAHAVAEEVVDAWHLLGVGGVPVHLGPGDDPSEQPFEHRALAGHLSQYTKDPAGYHAAHAEARAGGRSKWSAAAAWEHTTT